MVKGLSLGARLMGTRKDRNREIGEDAVNVVEGILRGADWNLSKPQPDNVGLDMRVDLLEDRHPQISFYLQIKGMGPKTTKGKKQRLVSQTGTINKSIELEHLDYYMKLPVPVFLVVVDVVERVAYYVHLQRYVLEVLRDDDWRARLCAHNEARGKGRSKTTPTKTIQVPIKNTLSDTTTFRDDVRDAKGYMESLSVEPGIKYREADLARLDERFKVTYIRDREGGHFQIDAKEPVKLKLHAELPKKKFDEMFGQGLRVSIDPGEVTIEGSPLLEKITFKSKEIHIKHERQGFINVIRLDETGKQVARLEHLAAHIEGGLDTWRIKFHLPSNMFAIEFDLNFGAIRDNPTSRLEMTSTLKYRNNLASHRGIPVASLGYFDHALAVLDGLKDFDRIRFEIGVQGIGVIGGYTLPQNVTELMAGIGRLYRSLDKAKKIGKFFNITPRIPAKLSDEDLDDLDFLYELIQGGEVSSPQRIGIITLQVNRDSEMWISSAFSNPSSTQLPLVSDAQFSCLGETIHVDKLVRRITHARLITKESDLDRMLREPTDAIILQFETTPESVQTVQLGDLTEPSRAKPGALFPSDSPS